MALFLQQHQGKGSVLRRQCRSVVEMRARTQMEGQPVAIALHAFGDKAIKRIGFVERPRHQRVENQVQALRRIALEDIGIEGIEGENRTLADMGKGSALGGGRVDIVEMGKAGRIFQLAEERHAVTAGSRLAGAWQPRQGECGTGQRQHVPPGKRQGTAHGASSMASGSVAPSCHHIVGKPIE